MHRHVFTQYSLQHLGNAGDNVIQVVEFRLHHLAPAKGQLAGA
jgi:hypothetical protein